MNEYYTKTTDVIPYSRSRDTDIDIPLEQIETGFDKLPRPHLTKKGFRDPVPVGNATAQDEAVSVGQLLTGSLFFGIDQGSANSYEIAATIPPETYENGLLVGFVAASSNTGASSLNVSGLGPKELKTHSGESLLMGCISTGQPVIAYYSGSYGHFRIVSNIPGPGESASASARLAEEFALAAEESRNEAENFKNLVESHLLVESPVMTSEFTAEVNTIYPVDSSSGGFNITLPANPAPCDRVLFSSCGFLETKPCIFLRNGHILHGKEEDWLYDWDGIIEIWFVNGEWRFKV